MTIVVPAIDLLGGKVVRVEHGDLDRAKVYSDDPIRIARKFVERGATLIHMVDLDAAVRSDTMTNRRILDDLLQQLGRDVKIQIAGGIRTLETATSLVERGTSRIVIGSLAYSNLQIAIDILKALRTSDVVLALDYDDLGHVKTHGWKQDETELARTEVHRFSILGFRNFLLTSISRDGMMKGPDFENLKIFRQSLDDSTRIIASGGVTTEQDIANLSALRIDEAIVGTSLYEGKIPLSVLRGVNR